MGSGREHKVASGRKHKVGSGRKHKVASGRELKGLVAQGWSRKRYRGTTPYTDLPSLNNPQPDTITV